MTKEENLKKIITKSSVEKFARLWKGLKITAIAYQELQERYQKVTKSGFPKKADIKIQLKYSLKTKVSLQMINYITFTMTLFSILFSGFSLVIRAIPHVFPAILA